MNPEKLILNVVLIILFTIINHQLSFAQDSLFNLRFDTLSINESLKIQRDFFSYNMKYDSTHIELYYKEQRFAIVTISLRKQINQKWIKSTKYETEILKDNRVLLRMLFYMNFN